MSRTVDLWLTRRAAQGDQHAFAALVDEHAASIRRVAYHYAARDAELEDLQQIVKQRLWIEMQRGNWNWRNGFAAFVAHAGRDALHADWQRRRATKRWDPLGPPVSLDLVLDPDPDSDAPAYRHPSRHLGTDPLRVVIERETLREAWEALTAGQMRAINAWLHTDGIRQPSAVTTLVCEGRKRVRPILAGGAVPLRLH